MMRVLVVAADRPTADAIRRALRYGPPCDVIGYVNAHRAEAATVIRAEADVVVIDDVEPTTDAVPLVRRLRVALPGVKLVLLTDSMDAERLGKASNVGLDAAIARSAGPAVIGMLVREVVAGHIYHGFSQETTKQDSAPALQTLTSREIEILRLVSAGLSNGRVAERLYVTEQTVKFHLSNVYRKLGLANRTEASHYAHVNGLLDSSAADEPRAVAVAA